MRKDRVALAREPTILQLAINLKATKAIGLTIHESFRLRAD